MSGKTMRGKTVGTYRQPLQNWTYWPERWNSQDGFVVVAPSGARTKWFATRAETLDEVARKNEEW